MENFHVAFTIKAANGTEAAKIKKLFEHMATKMDRKKLVQAAEKVMAKPEQKIKRLETGVGLL